jgi:HAD superfamily hydrolase (TIGR01509 family)
MDRPSLVIFDLDGTLIDTLPGTFRAVRAAVAPVIGYEPTEDEIRARFGPADQRIVAEWVGPDEAEAAVARLYAAYEREFAGTRLFPGLEPVLTGLAEAGIGQAIFTGRGRRSTDWLLEGTGLAGRFSPVVTSDDVDDPKPAPDGLLRILERTGRAPREAVYVGDSPLDVRAARAAGIRPLAVFWGTSEPEALRATPAQAVATPEDLAAVLLA